MNDTPHDLTDALDYALQTATDRIRPDVLLLSGGLDSSLLAAMWTKQGHRFKVVTVGLDPNIRCTPAHRYLPYPCNSDIAWARTVAAHRYLDWRPVIHAWHGAVETRDPFMLQKQSFDLGQLSMFALRASPLHAT